MINNRTLWPLALAAILLSPPIWADRWEEIEDHERARRLVAEGVIMPLDALLQRAALSPSWELLEVELEREDGRWVYELELLQERGKVVEFQYDAQTGQLLDSE